MPRKASKTNKPALLFLEAPAGGAKLKPAPEVRAAINPKEFFPETRKNSSINSWVNSQFDCTDALTPPRRRGRVKSATSIRDSCSQLSRKTGVCKYPCLSFQRQRAASDAGNRSFGERQLAKTRNGTNKSFSAASQKRCLELLEKPCADATERCGTPVASAPQGREFEVSWIDPAPDVETPKRRNERSGRSSVHFLLAEPLTPPSDPTPAALVADTPERDYGLKVTWRRRRTLMLTLMQRGHLTESASLIHNDMKS